VESPFHKVFHNVENMWKTATYRGNIFHHVEEIVSFVEYLHMVEKSKIFPPGSLVLSSSISIKYYFG